MLFRSACYDPSGKLRWKVTLVKDGDHRLSRPEDIERMLAAVKEF